ncbi:MAG: histidinol-phosphatase [Gammaproteobacteria bacterium]
MSDEPSVPEITGFLVELARIAGNAILPHFRTSVAIEDKGGKRFDPVTIADREAERVLRAAIAARYPTHGILGEEFGEQAGTAPYRWIIDPIDGTRAFVSGLPTWGTLVALCEGPRPLFGLMAQPWVGECFIGSPGGAVWQRAEVTRSLSSRPTAELADATLFATAPEMFDAREWTRFDALSRATRMTRYGADCYAYCLLAAGHVDLVVEAGLGFYDIAALVPIVEGAGGVVTHWDGAPISAGGRVVAAANRQLHARALTYLRDAGHG